MDEVRFDVDENHAYWRKVNPDGYLKAGPERGQALIDLLRELNISEQASILELGCNCGRNLAQLHDAGWHRAHGVELNPKAVRYFHANYQGDRPEIVVECSTIEDFARDKADRHVKYDVIFTMAVLFHMHPDSEWCFADIAKTVGQCLILIECETSHVPPRHYRRCYKTIFEELGLRELFHRQGFGDLTNKYRLRVFVPA